MQFSSEKQIDTFKPPVSAVIKFLTQLFEHGLKYSALGTARAAINNFVRICGDLELSHNSIIQRFMRGAFLKRPTIPKYNETWDVAVVLTYLENLQDTTLFQLSGKMYVILVAICTEMSNFTLN